MDNLTRRTIRNNPNIIQKTILLAWIFFTFPEVSQSQLIQDESLRREQIIKASLILKFTAFIKWPNSSNPFNLCVHGDNPSKTVWNLVKNEGYLNQQLKVDFLNDSPKYEKCHIIFVAKKNNTLIKRVIKSTQNSPVLIIGDSPGYANFGAGINFIKKDNKIKFEINQTSLTKRGLKISSELLSLGILIPGKIQ